MNNSIVANFNDDRQDNMEVLVNQWLEDERSGIQFPVDFDIAWKIAGYAEKGKGVRRLTGKNSPLVENEDYILKKGGFHQSGKSLLNGRSSDSIKLTCDAFKHFCLMAQTEEGRQIRQYFIDAEKKWKLVQQNHPHIARQVEQQQSETDKLILLEQLRLKNKEMDDTMLKLHGKAVVLALRGCQDQIVKEEVVVTEVVNLNKKKSDRIVSADSLKRYVQERHGVKIKSMKDITDTLTKLGRDDLLVSVERSSSNLYIKAEKLNEALNIVFDNTSKQLLLGQ